MATGEIATDLKELHSGDHMSREEFHAIYSQMPEDFRAELIGGIVYVASPMKRPHGRYHITFGMLIGIYMAKTTGVDAADNATIILSEDDEPQPDVALYVMPEYGGHTRVTDDDYIEGAPELIAEVACSSVSIDLHTKRSEYARHGVLEYLVLDLKDNRVHWFDLTADRELPVDSDGVIRAKTFPGLWIDVEALLKRDHARLMETLEAGIATPEHAEFVERLKSQFRGEA